MPRPLPPRRSPRTTGASPTTAPRAATPGAEDASSAPDGSCARLWIRLLLAAALGPLLPLGETPAHGADESFSRIVTQDTAETFRKVAAHLERRPPPRDASRAYVWVFQTAAEWGLEDQALPLAEKCLADESQPSNVREAARRIKALGAARAGKMPVALEEFTAILRATRARNADSVLDFGIALAAIAQIGGDHAAARTVYEKLPEPFFLNPQVRQLCQDRLDKLALAGEKPPEIGVKDLEGKKVDPADYAGKVLLIDFWATNCPPCLEELPEIRELYEERKGQGFEVVGISLDEDPEFVAEFAKRAGISWRMALSATDEDETRTRFRTRTIPTTFVLGRDGKIAFVDLRGRDLRRAVEKILDDPAPPRP